MSEGELMTMRIENLMWSESISKEPRDDKEPRIKREKPYTLPSLTTKNPPGDMDGHKPAGDGIRQPIRWNKPPLRAGDRLRRPMVTKTGLEVFGRTIAE